MSERLRALTEADAGLVTELMNRHWPEPLQDDVILGQWSAPSFDLAQDARLEDGGYAHVQDFGEGRMFLGLHGSPSAELLAWAEERARTKGGERIVSGAWATNRAVVGDLERRGYRPIRYSRRMTIALGGLDEKPAWPDGIQVGSMRAGEERVFYETHQETFEDTWEPIRESYEEWAHALLSAPSFDRDLWFAARAGSEIAGVAICNVRPGDPDVGLVYILGVRRPWRGRGVGRALLLHALWSFKTRGLERAGLGVDAESPTGADRLYESIGMVESARFDIYELAVR